MEILYFIGIKLYEGGIFISSFFNKKAKLWVQGRKNIFQTIQAALSGKKERRIWFHCASLGEFEQGKPIIEAVKINYPDYKIVLTFFSSSGYEIKKNTPVADYVFYLPADSPYHANKFLELVKPVFAIFVKYDFWHFYIRELKKKKIPLYVISANFRPNQIFFKWYGIFFDRILRRITHLFVQNQSSLELLYLNSIPQVTVSGDTRFDNVFDNSKHPKTFPEIEKFCAGKKIIVAGSTWQDDEKVIAGLIEKTSDDFKFIVAPHEIKEERIINFMNSISKKSIRFSELTPSDYDAQVVLIDNIGMLSSLYAYADFAYIGGAFRKKLHNILEAVVFGKPVFFGPYFQKFPEAVELVKNKTAFSISSSEELKNKIDELLKAPSALEEIKKSNGNYIDKNRGATSIVMNYLKLNFGERLSVLFLLMPLIY